MKAVPKRSIKKMQKKRSKRRSQSGVQIHRDLKHLIEISWCHRRQVFEAAIPDFGVISWGHSYEEALQMLAKASMLTLDLLKIYKSEIPKAARRPQWLLRSKG